MTVGDSAFDISAFAGFMDSLTGANQTVQSLYVNHHALSMDSTYYFDYPFAGYAAQGKALPGTYSTVTITGSNSADTVTGSFYVPHDIGLTLMGCPGLSLPGADFSVPVTITWKPDPHSAELVVGISIVYMGGLSQQNNPALPSSIKSLDYIVPDNGSFTIPASDLDVYPVNAVLNIEIGRVSQITVVLPISNRRVWLYGLAEVNVAPFPVVKE